MRLDKLNWEELGEFTVARIGKLIIWQFDAKYLSTTGDDYLAGTYAITVSRRDPPVYRNLDPIEAQAILYHLLKE